MKKIKFSALLLLVLSQTVLATPVTIKANSAEFKPKLGINVFKGNVTVKQDNSELKAPLLIVHNSKQNKLNLVIAKGNEKKLAQFASSQPNKPRTLGHADEIQFNPITHIVTLLGHAQVIQNNNHMNAAKIIYNSQTGHVISNGDDAHQMVIVIHNTKNILTSKKS